MSKHSIKDCLVRRYQMTSLDLWADIHTIHVLRDQARTIQEKLSNEMEKKIDENEKLKKIKKLGFTLVIYDYDRVGFVNYDKTIQNEKGHEEYYSFSLSEKGEYRVNPNNPLSDQDYKNLSEILES